MARDSTGAQDLASTLGAAFALVHSGNAADQLPTFRMLAERIGELPSDGESGPLLRGMIHEGGFAAAYAAGHFAEAHRFADAACEALRSVSGVEFIQARGLNNRGLALLELGDLVGAERDFHAALVLLHDPKVRTAALNADALIRTVEDHFDILRQMREPGKARARMPARSASGMPVTEFPSFVHPAQRLAQTMNAALARASEARQRGAIDEGRRILQDGVNDARNIGEPRPLGIALSNLGEFLAESDETAALSILSESVEILERLPSPNEPLAIAQLNLSQVSHRVGNMARATDAAKRAWLLINEASPSSPAALSILYNLGKLRLLQNDMTRARAVLQHAMSIYDDTRGRLAEQESDHAGTFGMYRSLVELMLLIEVHEGWPNEAVTLIENAKGRFLSEHLRRLAEANLPGLANAPFLEPDQTSAEVAFSTQLAASETLILNLFTGLNITFVTWSAGKSSAAFRIAVSEAELRTRVEAFYSDLQSASLAQPWRRSGQELRELLFGRIEERLASSSTVLVLPDGPLWLVPFDALLLTVGRSNEAPATTGVYSAFSLRSVTQLRKLDSAHRGRALIVAKSNFQHYPNLGTVSEEAAAITEQVEHIGLAPTILRETDATAAKVLRAMHNAEIIHLATHAVAPPDGGDPYIVLDDGSGGDAILPLKEIAALRLSARLVFLSVCSSGIGLESVGEGVVSIARAFILTGCKSVIASLWPVVTDDAAILAERFYKELAQHHSPAVALQRAKGGWRNGGSFMRTAAAFQIYGDGEGRFTLDDVAELIRSRL